MFNNRFLRVLLVLFTIAVAGFFLWRIFFLPLAIVVNLGVNTNFGPADFNYNAGGTHIPQPDQNVSGSVEKKVNGNVIEVSAMVEGRTEALWEAYAWQQVGVEFDIPGPAGISRLAKITYVLDYETQTSATRDDVSHAKAIYGGAYETKEKPANPIMIVSTRQPGRLPIISEVPPNNSEFHQDAQTNVSVTTTGVLLKSGKTYVAIVQAKAAVQLQGSGSAQSLGKDAPLKMTLKQIKIEWM